MLDGKKGLVLGVANKRSLAWAIARACATRGARLGITYQSSRFESGTRELTDTLPNPAEHLVLQCEITKQEDIDSLVAAVKAKWGRLDFVVHSIAFANPEELRRPFSETSKDGFHLALEVSAYSLVPLAKACAPLMTEGGSIVALSYLGGERVVPNYNVMGVAKAALDSTVRYLAYDLGPKGIRVNSVSPGPVRTVSASSIADFGKMLEHVEKVAPLRRNITSEEVGDVCAFMVSDMARGISGQQIHVDSGYSIMGVTTVAEVPEAKA